MPRRISPAPDRLQVSAMKPKPSHALDLDGAMSTRSATTISSGSFSSKSSGSNPKSKIFPSTRFFMAVLLCFCYISLSISTSNISVSMVCMVKKTTINESTVKIISDILRIRREVNDTVLDSIIDLQVEVQNGTVQWGNETRPMSKCALARYRKHAIEFSRNRDRELVTPGTSSETSSDNGNLIQELQLDGPWTDATVQIESCEDSGNFEWSSADQGIVFAAQNAGSLLMLATGMQADRLNSKWTIVLGLLLLVISNILVPLLASTSVWLVIGARVLTGLSDALLWPSASSMITRWFPPKERPFAIGLVTGGRQIGTLFIMPMAGVLCTRREILHGWPATFYLSALIGAFVLIVWLFMSADKPSKHFCISQTERYFVETKIEEERLGKRKERRKVPWRKILTCKPLYAGVAALICHEYPLVIMLQLLPSYLDRILNFPIATNGGVSALPIAVLFISKTLSSSLSSVIGSRKKGRLVISRTRLVKIFNGVASFGLAVCLAIAPLFSVEQRVWAIVVLCVAMVFAGMHTPGVQTALLQLAPAYTGLVNGIAFGSVAVVSIGNKIMTAYLTESGSVAAWTLVFEISAVVAILPVFFFSIWGSADRQPWASQKHVLASRIRAIEVVAKGPPVGGSDSGSSHASGGTTPQTAESTVDEDESRSNADIDEADVIACQIRMSTYLSDEYDSEEEDDDDDDLAEVSHSELEPGLVRSKGEDSSAAARY